MAQFTKVNGDFQQVLWLDAPEYTNGGLNAVNSGLTVQPQGPKLDFGTVTFTGAASPTGAEIAIAMQTIQQLATVYIYEYTEVGANTARHCGQCCKVKFFSLATRSTSDHSRSSSGKP